MTKCSNINSEYHRSFYFKGGNAYAKNTLSKSKISNKIVLNKKKQIFKYFYIQLNIKNKLYERDLILEFAKKVVYEK